MNKETDINREFELSVKEAASVEFWRAEYIKRLFYMDTYYYNNLLSRYKTIIKKWDLFTKTNDIHQENLEFNLRDFLYGFSRDIGWNTNFKTNDNNLLYTNFTLKSDVVGIGNSIHEACSFFGFYFDDLISRTDMSILLGEREFITPPPPDRYWHNTHFHPKFPQGILTFMAQDPSTPTLINYMGNEWRQIYREFKNSPHSLYLPPGANLLSIDFAITGKSIHHDFDLDIALMEIKDFLTWNVYVLKKKFEIPLKDNEKNAMIDLYQRMISGNYAEQHAPARAIGLWLWDEIRNTKCSIAQAIRSYEEQKFDASYATRDERTFRRWLKRTKDCIEHGDVLSLIKTGCKNKKMTKS